MIFGASGMLVALVACYRESQRGLEDGKAGLYICIACFIMYFTGAVWYAYRIRQGSWQRVWIYILRCLGRDL